MPNNAVIRNVETILPGPKTYPKRAAYFTSPNPMPRVKYQTPPKSRNAPEATAKRKTKSVNAWLPSRIITKAVKATSKMSGILNDFKSIMAIKMQKKIIIVLISKYIFSIVPNVYKKEKQKIKKKRDFTLFSL